EGKPLTVAAVKAKFHFPVVPLLPGTHPAFGLVTDLRLGNLSDREKLTAALGQEVRRRFVFPSAPLAANPANAVRLAAEVDLHTAERKKQLLAYAETRPWEQRPGGRPELLTLGADETKDHLQVVLTTQGGGIR